MTSMARDNLSRTPSITLGAAIAALAAAASLSLGAGTASAEYGTGEGSGGGSGGFDLVAPEPSPAVTLPGGVIHAPTAPQASQLVPNSQRQRYNYRTQLGVADADSSAGGSRS